MLKKIKEIKNRLVEIYNTYPHLIIIGLLIIISFVVSVANDAYFGAVFKENNPIVVQPQKPTPVFLNVIQVDPKPGVRKSLDTFTEFTIEFTDKIDPTSVTLTSIPDQNLGFEVIENKVRVFPYLNWKYETAYEIKVNAKSTNGFSLKDPYIYNLYLAIPDDTSAFEIF